MKIYVYGGPTLVGLEPQQLLDATYLPPVKFGDLLNALSESVDCIAIIDGYYSSVLACRHKEIVEVLKQGIRVIGAAGMGALRAAEMSRYGMEGIGKLYSMFADNILEGDDEIAVKHSPASEGYKQLTVALANLRFNLNAMVNDNLLEPAVADLIINCATRMSFAERNLTNIFQRATDQGLSNDIARQCQEHLIMYWQDLKRTDAKLLLDTIAKRVKGEAEWPQVKPLAVKETSWVRGWKLNDTMIKTLPRNFRNSEIVSHCKYSTNIFNTIRQQINERSWLLSYAAQQNIKPDIVEIETQFESICLEEGLNNTKEQTDWLAARLLTITEFQQEANSRATLAKLCNLLAPAEPLPQVKLLLDYAQQSALAARAAEITSEWQKLWLEIKDQEFDLAENSNALRKIDFSGELSLKKLTAPDWQDWCQQNRVESNLLLALLNERVLLRKFALQASPGTVGMEMIITQLKFKGYFDKSISELVNIYQKLIDNGISIDWHPQWKFFFESDITVLLGWYCKKHQVPGKFIKQHVSWKGFNQSEWPDFINIAQLHYLADRFCRI